MPSDANGNGRKGGMCLPNNHACVLFEKEMEIHQA